MDLLRLRYIKESQRHQRHKCVHKTKDETHKKINELRFLPGRAIVMYRESDLCAHLIGAVFTFDMMLVVC